MKKSLWEACVKDLAILRQRVPESTEKECVEAINKIKKMFKTHDSSNCFGLAANQVGINTRACLLTIPPHYMPEKKSKDRIIYEFHNPKIVSWSGSAVNQEWCYSLSPKESYIVKRYKEITIQDDKNGMTKLNGVPAYAAQHEIDHLNGKVICDRGAPAKKIMETISGTQSLNSPCNCGSGKKFKPRPPEPAK
jgi:peptide deformylase